MMKYYIFVMRNRAHSNNIHKWIIDSAASKNMTSHGVTFDTYDVSFHSMYIWMIIVLSKPSVWDSWLWKQSQKIISTEFVYKYALCAQVACQFALSEQIYVERFEGSIQYEQMHCKILR